MRSVLVCVSLGVLAGCATVSVVPGETTVETALTKSQSALRKTSDAYCDHLAAKGWAEADKGLAGFADLLIRGRSASEQTLPAYASEIGAASRAPVLVLARISSDSESARKGLEDVTLEARDVLGNARGDASNRNDVIAFERALVRAQMAHRNFRTRSKSSRPALTWMSPRWKPNSVILLPRSTRPAASPTTLPSVIPALSAPRPDRAALRRTRPARSGSILPEGSIRPVA